MYNGAGGLVLLNAGTNLVSEARDFHRGLDTPDSLGSRNVLVEGLLEPKQVFRAGLGAFAAGSAAEENFGCEKIFSRRRMLQRAEQRISF